MRWKGRGAPTKGKTIEPPTEPTALPLFSSTFYLLLLPDGIFESRHAQSTCASKYKGMFPKVQGIVTGQSRDRHSERLGALVLMKEQPPGAEHRLEMTEPGSSMPGLVRHFQARASFTFDRPQK